jgi:hypothetical protein
MPNPLIAQGSLNRLRASIVWPSNASLNVTASYLGRMGIRLALDGESTLYIPTMTGAVTSPEPYMMITCTIHLLKTQQLAGLYKAQMETNALLGDGTVRPDVAAGNGLGPYQITNCAIESVAELAFAGDDPGFSVRIRGYYLVNSSMWD